MTRNNLVSTAIILVALTFFSIIAVRWHNERVELNVREAIAKSEGTVQELLKQSIAKDKEMDSYKSKIDSLKKIKHDTVTLYNTLYVQKNAARNLGTDASITFLSNNLSK